MEYGIKLILYTKGNYICEVPPVPTAQWSTHAWINWIDSHGKWVEEGLNPEGGNHEA